MREEIIKMAREAGLPAFLYPEMIAETDWVLIERFFHMAQAAEREQIARMIEDAPPLVDFCKNDQNGCMVCGFTPKVAAAAIRARGQA